MEFTRIQDKDTLNITQYRVNGKRVRKSDYEHWENVCRGMYSASVTRRTKSGNFKHVYWKAYS